MSVDSLFQPLTLGSLDLPNRIIMAPLTRGRASEANVPQPVMGTYYAQRADAGLLISEATAVHPGGMGWYLKRSVLQIETERVAAIILSIIVLVLISELLSAWARNTVMKMK